MTRYGVPLGSGMDNIQAMEIGRVMSRARAVPQTDIGDSIDGGIILCRLLREHGFDVIARNPSNG